MMNTEQLKERIRLSGFTLGEIADKLEINRSTFYRKLSCGGGTFLLWEIKAIINHLNLTKQDVEDIFLYKGGKAV